MTVMCIMSWEEFIKLENSGFSIVKMAKEVCDVMESVQLAYAIKRAVQDAGVRRADVAVALACLLCQLATDTVVACGVAPTGAPTSEESSQN